MLCLQISNISAPNPKNLNFSRLVLQLSLPYPLKSGVKSRMKIQLEQRRLRNIPGDLLCFYSYNGTSLYTVLICTETKRNLHWSPWNTGAWHPSPSCRLLHRVLMYSGRSTTLSLRKKLTSWTAKLEWGHVHFSRDSYSTFIRPGKNSTELFSM